MKKVLQIVGPINGGGVSGVVYNYLSHMDLTDLQIDVLAFENDSVEEQMFDKPLRKIGCTIHFLKHRNQGYFSHFKAYTNLLKQNRYDVVHCHFGIWSAPYMLIAKKNGIVTRIAHAHGSVSEYGFVKNLIVKIMKPVLYTCTIHKFACGEKAGRYVWGNKLFTVINNAIDLGKFEFDKEKRNLIRSEMQLNSFVIGFVGRLSAEKNLDFIVEIANEMKSKFVDFTLLIIGDGEKSDDVREKIDSYNLQSKVLMLGMRKDISELMQAIDCLILPSFHEGFPVVVVEAQASGLSVFLSDTISNEVKVLDSTIFLPINEGPQKWVEELMNVNINIRSSTLEKMKMAGYDIVTEAQILKDYYLN